MQTTRAEDCQQPLQVTGVGGAGTDSTSPLGRATRPAQDCAAEQGFHGPPSCFGVGTLAGRKWLSAALLGCSLGLAACSGESGTALKATVETQPPANPVVPADSKQPVEAAATVAPTRTELERGIAAAPVTDQPKLANLADGGDSAEFGQVFAGEVLEHVFRLQSCGDADLVVSRIKPSCGCTLADTTVITGDGSRTAYEDGAVLPTGAILEIRASLDTSGRNGHQKKGISIFCNDPRGVHLVEMVADVEPFLVVSPDRARMGRAATGKRRTIEFEVTVSDGKPARLWVLPERSTEHTSGELVPIEPDGDGRSTRWNLTLIAEPELPVGNHGLKLELRSDRSDVPGDWIPGDGGGLEGAEEASPSNSEAADDGATAAVGPGAVVWAQIEVLPLYQLSTPQVFFGYLKPGTLASRSVRLNSYDEEFKLELPVVRVEGFEGEELPFAEHFRVVAEPVPSLPNAWDIQLQVDGLPDIAAGDFRGQVMIEVPNPDYSPLVLRFNGVCRP